MDCANARLSARSALFRFCAYFGAAATGSGHDAVGWGQGDALVSDPCRCRHARPGGRSWEVDGGSGALDVVGVGEMSVRL